MNNPPKVNFNIRKIQTEQFAILENNFRPNDKTRFSFSFDFQINHSQRIIIVSLKFAFSQNNPFLVGKVVTHFGISNEDWNNFSAENQVIIPRLFMVHLGMITVGNTRGILHTKTEGTYFNHFVFPLINVLDSITTDIYFHLG